MTFSPELEEKFARLLTSYPAGKQRSAVIPMLLFAQDEVGHISREVIEEVARRCGVQPLQVEEVITYYTMLRHKPAGRHHVQICTNISCMLTGANELWEQARKTLGIANHGVTDDGVFSLEEVECLGACSWAPAMMVNYDFHLNVTPEKLAQLLAACRAAANGKTH